MLLLQALGFVSYKLYRRDIAFTSSRFYKLQVKKLFLRGNKLALNYEF